MKHYLLAAAALLALNAGNSFAASTTTYNNLGTACGIASSSRAIDVVNNACTGMYLTSNGISGLIGTKLDLNWGVDLSTTGGVFSNGKADVTLPDGRTLSCSNFSGSAVYPTAAQIKPAVLRIIPTYTFSLDGTCSGVDASTGKSFQLSTHQDGAVHYQLVRTIRVGSQIIPGGVVWSLWSTGGSVSITE